MPVEMRLSKIIISEINENQMVYLQEVDGERSLRIVIGIFEATSIDRRVKSFDRPRPLTHDLLAGTIEALGGELESITIHDLQDGTFFACLQVRQNGTLLTIDARPSDAIALAVTTEPPTPIFVEDHVMDEAAVVLRKE